MCCLWVGCRRRLVLFARHLRARLTRRIYDYSRIYTRRPANTLLPELEPPTDHKLPDLFGGISDFEFQFEHANSLATGADIARTVTEPSARQRRASFPLKQPETRSISQEQLVAEVESIYAGLVMVEAKCIEVDSALSTQGDGANTKLNNEEWQALIALHRTLLHEFHDFFLVTQHPSASPALRRLASNYAMPVRMWRHASTAFSSF